MIKYRIFFAYASHGSDSIIITADSMDEIRAKVNSMLAIRNAKYNGSERLGDE